MSCELAVFSAAELLVWSPEWREANVEKARGKAAGLLGAWCC